MSDMFRQLDGGYASYEENDLTYIKKQEDNPRLLIRRNTWLI